MEPPHPAGSRRRRGMPPSPLGPSSGSAIPAAADGDDEAAVSEHPCVTLDEWWLTNVEGDDEKVAVAGIFQRNQIHLDYSPAPIAKRHEPRVLETEDGTILRLHGSHKVSQTYRNGYSKKVCEEFVNEFPEWWKLCKVLYPKLTNTQTERQPCSSDTSNSGVDSTEFYLKQYELGKRLDLEGRHLISKCPGISEHFSHSDAVQKSSHLLNGKPRFEEYTCDGDIATDENAAASSKAATDRKTTPAACLKNQGSLGGIQHMASNKKPVGRPKKPHEKRKSATRSHETRSPESLENASTGGWSHTLSVTCSATPGLLAGSPSNERGHDDIATDVSLAPTVPCTNNAVSEALYSTPATDLKTALVACLKNQGSLGGIQHIASNKKPVGRPKKLHKKRQSATRSHGTRSPVSQPVGRPKKPHKKRQSATRSHGTRSPVSQPVDRTQKQISPQEKCQSATGFLVTTNSVSYAHRSPPTRGKNTSLSMTTVEALNLKRSGSGRVIVPKLVEGYQSIAYGSDGSIIGVIGDPPAVFKWSGSKSNRRKKRKTMSNLQS